MYILNGYGIDTDMLPISWTGNVKASYTWFLWQGNSSYSWLLCSTDSALRQLLTELFFKSTTTTINSGTLSNSFKVAYLKHWMRIRNYLDDPSLHTHSSCDCSTITKGNRIRKDHTCAKFSPPIECPLLTDIIFKKGKSARNHPGNIHFRSRLQMKYELERSAFASSVTPEHPCGMEVFGKNTKFTMIKSLVDFFVEEVQKGNLRVLLWNEKQSWWRILTDERTIRKKIDNTVMSCIESTSSPHTEVRPHQHQDLLEPISCFGECNRRDNPQHLEDFARMLTSQGGENSRKRRKLVYNGISGVNAKRSANVHDAEKNFITKQCFGWKPDMLCKALESAIEIQQQIE